MNDEQQHNKADDCDCDSCQALKKFGYGGCHSWAENNISPALALISNAAEATFTTIREKVGAGEQTPQDAKNAVLVMNTTVITKLMNAAVLVAATTGWSFRDFVGFAADLWNDSVPRKNPIESLVEALNKAVSEQQQEKETGISTDLPDPFTTKPRKDEVH